MLYRLALVVVFASTLTAAQDETTVSRGDFTAFERELLRERPPAGGDVTPEADGSYPVEAVQVELPDGRTIPVFVQLPPKFDPTRRWPVMLAMHGGPTRDAASALRGAVRMLSVWLEPAADAGWIVVSPAMTHVIARGARTVDRLPYEILTAEQIDAILRRIDELHPLDPNRIVSTGISLGSNFSIAYAASRPGRLAAIVPVSTEGESREHVLRNLMHVPTFVLEGSLDPNIRGIAGPRALDAILTSFDYDHVYRELGDRAHEGFQESYPEVLEWLEARPRDPYPKEILRVPHPGIMPIARRAHWIESDTRSAVVRARVVGRNRIDIETRRARTLRIFVHDRLVELDEPIEIWVNGERTYRGTIKRSIEFARDDLRVTGDRGRVYAAAVTVDVPTSAASLEVARALTASLEPGHPQGVLSYWETYAMRSLEDRLAPLGIEGERGESMNGEQTTLRVREVTEGGPFHRAGVRAGDDVIEIDGEPFFVGQQAGWLRSWLVRELDERPREIAVRLRRGGEEQTLLATLSLDAF